MSEWTSAGLLAAGQFSDPEHARLIYLAAGGLLAAGLLLAVGTWLWWRGAKVEHPALGPLEVMGTRRWLRGDFIDRTRRLEAVRPVHEAGAEGVPAAPELVDLDMMRNQGAPHDFGDLADPTGGTVVDAALDVEAVLAAPTVPVVPAAPEVVPAAPEVVEVEAAEPEDPAEPEVAETVPEVAPAEPAVDVEPVVLESLVAAESPSGSMLRSIVIDTSPKARDTGEAAPLVDATPSSAPIDPLLRLWSE